MEKLNIFRKEAINSKNLDWIGKHPLTLTKTPFSPLVFSLLTIGMIGSLMTFGSYGINVETSGLVLFRPGIYTLTSPLDGVVTTAKTDQGEKVIKGEILYKITSRIILSGEEKHEKKQIFIREKIASLQLRKKDLATSAERVKENFLRKNILKKEELSYYHQLSTTINKKIELAERRNALFCKHSKNGIITKMELHDAARQLLDAKEESQRIKVLVSQINFVIKTLHISFDQELESIKTKLAEYDQQLADAHQELTEASSAASADVNAPLQGKLGYSSITTGDAVKKGDVIGIVLPDGAKPTISLNVSSTAIGEIRAGQMVKIRVSSFPWRKYGKLNGIVKTVSPVAIRAQDGMFFSVTVDPDNHSDFPLQHGMEVTANIVTGERRVYQWLFNFIVKKWES